MNILTLACSKSLKENLAYGVYYDPIERNHKPFQYLGFYNKQTIVAIGQLTKIVAADLISGRLSIRPEYEETLTQAEENRIINTIKVSNYDIAKNHKFILVKNVTTTNFVKGTRGPMRWKKYISLSDYQNILSTDSIADIALKLNGHIW